MSFFKNFAKWITILSIPVFMAGCGGSSSSSDSSNSSSGSGETGGTTEIITRGGTVEDIVLGDNTIMLDSSYVESYNSDTEEIHIREDVANKLRSGDIILIPEKGIWKKVEGFSYNSINRSVSEDRAINLINTTIEETFKELEINERIPIYKTISVDKIVYDQDGNNLTTNDQVRAMGNIFLSGDANFWLEVYNSTLERTGLSNEFELDSDLELIIGRDVTGDISRREFSLPPINLTPILVPLPTPVVEITPQINLLPNFEGFFGFEISDSPKVMYNAQINAEISYTKENGWNTEKFFEDNFDMILPTIGDRYAEIKAGLSMQFFPRFYHLAGPFVEVEGGLEFNLSTSENPYWTFGPYVKGSLGVEADLFGFLNAKKEINIYSESFIWAQAEGGFGENGEDEGDTSEDTSLFSEDFVRLAKGRSPRWSPDGKTIAYICEDDICLYNTQTEQTSNLGLNFYINNIFWSPDGQNLGFISDKDGNNELYTIDKNGTQQYSRLTNTSLNEYNGDWNEGKIVFEANDGNTFENKIFIINADGSEPTPTQLTTSSDYYDAYNPRFKDGLIYFLSKAHYWSSQALSYMDLDGGNKRVKMSFELTDDNWYDFNFDSSKTHLVYSDGQNYVSKLGLYVFEKISYSTLEQTSGQSINLNGSLSPDHKWLLFDSDRRCDANYCYRDIYVKNVEEAVNNHNP